MLTSGQITATDSYLSSKWITGTFGTAGGVFLPLGV